MSCNLPFTDTVAQMVKRPLYDRQVVGSIHGRVIPKTLKSISCSFAWRSAFKKSSARNQTWLAQCLNKVTRCNIMSSVCGVIVQ